MIQVTWSLNDNETRQRELAGILEAAEATDCGNLWIITADNTEEIHTENGHTIHVVPAHQWLLKV